MSLTDTAIRVLRYVSALAAYSTLCYTAVPKEKWS
jgi:hypothetical protein